MNDKFLQLNELTMECEKIHQKKLLETEKRLFEGKEQFIDWEKAKQDLRKEF